jgi:N-methylhydantoinase B/oxoprolinase/acetone carboxylase alpha subunit
MKTIQILFVLALMLLSIDTASAQYGTTVITEGYGGGGYGRNNRMNQMPQAQARQTLKKSLSK